MNIEGLKFNRGFCFFRWILAVADIGIIAHRTGNPSLALSGSHFLLLLLIPRPGAG